MRDWGKTPSMRVMEQFIREIEDYTAAADMTPQKFLRDVINAKWGQWQKWKDREASPTLKVVDRLRAYMAAHPAVPKEDAA